MQPHHRLLADYYDGRSKPVSARKKSKYRMLCKNIFYYKDL